MFSANDSITYKITGIAGLTAADFDYLSQPAGGSGPFYAAAHIQGLANGDSTWIEPGQGPINVVPEPSPLSLFAMSIGLWGAWRLRTRPRLTPLMIKCPAVNRRLRDAAIPPAVQQRLRHPAPFTAC